LGSIGDCKAWHSSGIAPIVGKEIHFLKIGEPRDGR
jgi:hypothetical protein